MQKLSCQTILWSDYCLLVVTGNLLMTHLGFVPLVFHVLFLRIFPSLSSSCCKSVEFLLPLSCFILLLMVFFLISDWLSALLWKLGSQVIQLILVQ